MKYANLLTGFLKRLFRRQDGTILMEFAYTVPIILMLLIGGFETFRILMIERKVNHTVNSVANLISQNELLATEMITDTFDAVDNVMAPFEINNGGRVLVSRLQGTSAGTLITDQCFSGSGLVADSKLGNKDEYADLAAIPGTFALAEDEIAIVAEVYFIYQPKFVDLSYIFPTTTFDQRNVYQISVHKPRFGDVVFSGGCPTS